MDNEILPDPLVFQWDRGNTYKNWLRHKVSQKEAEDAFYDTWRILWKDKVHSGKEPRYILLGMTESGRLLFVAFTVRLNFARIISARDANKRERSIYAIEKEKKEKINFT